MYKGSKKNKILSNKFNRRDSTLSHWKKIENIVEKIFLDLNK